MEDELEIYRQARSAGNSVGAWQALERVHIISQPFLGLHLSSHWTMLGFAVFQRDAKEVVGQVARLLLAPLGALTGRIPTGNTGRSNVSAFEPMTIPKELADRMQSERP